MEAVFGSNEALFLISRAGQDLIIMTSQFKILTYLIIMLKQPMRKGYQSAQQPRKEFQASIINYISNNNIQHSKQSEKREHQQHQKVQIGHENKANEEKLPQITRQKQRQEEANRSHTEPLSSLSARSSSPQPIVQKQPPTNTNVLFYLNKMPSQPNGEYIDKMHELWAKDYQRLERDHSFIQWLFPNSFQSRFNSSAKPLSSLQAEQFRTNPEIIERYLKSYNMMLAFYGIKMKDKHTGELMRSRNPDFKERMNKTLLTSFHNHMRITRILCSLTETGFGLYAAELCKFLKFQIQHKYGFMNSLQKYGVYQQWKSFEIYVQSKGLRSRYLQKINKRKEQGKNQTKGQGKVERPQEESLKQKDAQKTLENPARMKHQ